MNLIAVQDKMIATLVKCYRNSNANLGHKGKLHNCPPATVAENKAQRAIEAMGFTPMQAYRAVRDARDMAILQVECE